MTRHTLALSFVAALLSSVAGCGGDETSVAAALAPRPAHPATLEGLARVFQDAQKARDEKRLGELGASVTPSTLELRGLLRPGEATEAFLKEYATKGPVDWKADSDSGKSLGSGLFGPGEPKRTEVKAYSATTEEIAAYEKGSLAFLEFPGGMKRFAEKVAAPGRVWRIVVCVEPGHELGTKYACFTRLGDRWILVAKPWRFVPRDKSDAPDAPEPK